MRIYVAGTYSSDNVISILKNIREGIKISAKILKLGHSPFCPFLDHQFSFYEDFTVEDMYRYSIDWLRISEAIFVMPNSDNSKGTQKEIEIAKEMGIPIFYNLEEIK